MCKLCMATHKFATLHFSLVWITRAFSLACGVCCTSCPYLSALLSSLCEGLSLSQEKWTLVGCKNEGIVHLTCLVICRDVLYGHFERSKIRINTKYAYNTIVFLSNFGSAGF